MEWQASWEDPFRTFLSSFRSLIGDKRTGVTLAEIIRGIIGAGSVLCQRIAAQSPVLSKARNMAQRVIRLAKGQSTRRSQLDDVHLTAKLRERGIARLSEGDSDELWVILDGSPLCKPYARDMPALMKVSIRHFVRLNAPPSAYSTQGCGTRMASSYRATAP